jgi:hypothetical protein
MTVRSGVLVLGMTALLGLAAGRSDAADDDCMSNPASCPPVPTVYETCLVNGTGPAPSYRSYGTYFMGNHPFATLSEETKADVVTLMNNAARSFGFTPTTNLNWHAVGDAQGGYYKWFPHPTSPASSIYGFGLVLWNNKTGCAYFLSKNDSMVTSTSSRVIDKYASLDYERGALGLPTSNPHPFATGAYNTSWQRFTNGYITYRQGDAIAYYVGGASMALKAVASRYGQDFELGAGLNKYPLSMDVACVGAIAAGSCTGPTITGYYVRTNGGQRTILARKTAGTAYAVGSDLANRSLAIKWYGTYGAAPWTGALGFPKAEEAYSVDGVGRAQAFEGGDILWTPASLARIVLNGPLRDRWVALGREDGSLGYPVQDTPTGALPQVHAFMKGRVTRTAAGTTAIADSNGFVKDVVGSFARIPSTSAPRGFASYEPDGSHNMDGVSLIDHIQGAQRVGRNRFVLSSANNGAMYFATLGSRASVSAHQPWGALLPAPDPDLDHLDDVKLMHTDRAHLGGIQAVGDFIFNVSSDYCLGGDNNPNCEQETGSYLTLIDVNNPGVFVWNHLRLGQTLHAVGATKRTDGKYLIAMLGAGDNDIFFSVSNNTDIRNTTPPTPLYHWPYRADTTFYPNGSSAYGNFYNYQSINLVTQSNGDIFLIGTEQHATPAEDWAHLWRVDSCQSGRQPSCSCTAPDPNPNRICMTFIGRREMHVTNIMFGSYGDFDGGAGVYISPLGGQRDLFLYSTEKSLGGSIWGISEF